MKNKNTKIIIIFFIFLSSTIIIAFLIQKYNFNKYQQAHILFENEEYKQAERIYAELGNYKDSKELKEDMANYAVKLETYTSAINFLNRKKYNEAIKAFEKIINFKDSTGRLKEAKYNLGIEYYENHDYENAKKLFVELGDYSDSTFYLAQIDIKLFKQSQEIIYQKAYSYYKNSNYSNAIELYSSILNYKNSEELLNDCKKCLKRKSHNNIIAAGIRNSATITNENHVKIVGNSQHGQQNVDEWQEIISIDVYGNLTIGLQENKVAKITGTFDGNKTINLKDWNDLIDVAAGEQFVVGLKSGGSVIADGHPSDGQLKVNGWERIIAIDAGSRFTVGLNTDGELLFAGFDNGQENGFKNLNNEQKEEWKDVVNIAAGGSEKDGIGGGHTVGLKSDGTLVAVGDNSFGQCDFSDTEKWSDIVKIATGDWYTVGLKSDGTVVMTGENFSGHKYRDEEILNKYDNIVDIAAGYGQTLLLTDEGEIICFGFDDDGKDQLNGFKEAMIPQY